MNTEKLYEYLVKQGYNYRQIKFIIFYAEYSQWKQRQKRN